GTALPRHTRKSARCPRLWKPPSVRLYSTMRTPAISGFSSKSGRGLRSEVLLEKCAAALDRPAYCGRLCSAFSAGRFSEVRRRRRQSRDYPYEHLRRSVERLHRRSEWKRRCVFRLQQRRKDGCSGRERLDAGEL